MDIKIENVTADPNVIKSIPKADFIAAHPHLKDAGAIYDEFCKHASKSVKEVDLEKVEKGK